MIFESIFFWMAMAGIFLIIAVIAGLLNAMFMIKTHAVNELKAAMGNKELGHFYTDTGKFEVKALKKEAGVVQDVEMGSYLINPRVKYMDSKLRVPVHVFDSNFGCSMNVKAAKLAEDLTDIAKDQSQLSELKANVASGILDSETTIKCISSNIKIGSLREMMSVLTPHMISNLVNMQVARRLKNQNNNANGQMILAFLVGAGVVAVPMIIMKFIG